jgi:hypothetical protein
MRNLHINPSEHALVGVYLIQGVFGVYLIMVGLIMIIFRKRLTQMTDDWYESLPSVMSWWAPPGMVLTVIIILFGALSILIGIAQLLLSTVPQ